MMKDESRQPTSVEELEKIIIQADLADDVKAWLEWTYNFLSARKLYHKKARIRTAMLEKMAKTLLSKDELEAIDNEAEKQLGNLPEPTFEPEEVE
jgi:hypothetical protein